MKLEDYRNATLHRATRRVPSAPSAPTAPWKFAAGDAGQGARSASEECIEKYSMPRASQQRSPAPQQ